MQPSPPVDIREVRGAQGGIAVATLAAFVFGQPRILIVVFLVVAAGAALGPRANLFVVAARAVLAPWTADCPAPEPAARVRDLDLVATALLGIGGLALLAGIDLVGWLLALTEAGIAAVSASTGVNLAARLLLPVHRGTR